MSIEANKALIQKWVDEVLNTRASYALLMARLRNNGTISIISPCCNNWA